MKTGFSFSGIIADPDKGLGLVIDSQAHANPGSVIRDLLPGMYIRVLGSSITPYPGIIRDSGEIYPHNKAGANLFDQINWQITEITDSAVWIDYPVIPDGWENSPNVDQLPHFSAVIDSKGTVLANDCPWNISELSGADQFGWTDRKDRPDSCVNRPIGAIAQRGKRKANYLMIGLAIALAILVIYALYRIWN